MITGRVEDRTSYRQLRDKDLTSLVEIVANIENQIKYIVVEDNGEYKLNPNIDNAISTLTNENLNDINKIIDSMNDIKLLSQNIAKISYIDSKKNVYEALYENIQNIEKLLQDIPFVKDIKNNLCSAIEQSKRYALISKTHKDDSIRYFTKEVRPKIDTLSTHIETAIARLNRDVKEIELSHKNARDWYNSDIKLNIINMCYECNPFTTYIEPQYNEDGSVSERGTIIYHIPKPMCVHNVVPSESIVRDSVDAYLETLPNLGGSGLDEPITTDDLEPIEWYDLLGVATSGNVKIRHDSDNHGIVLSRFTNDGMDVNDTSLFTMKSYDINGMYVSRFDYNATYESDRALISVYNTEAHPLGYVLLSYKRDSNQADFDFTDVVIIYDTNDNKWKEQGS